MHKFQLLQCQVGAGTPRVFGRALRLALAVFALTSGSTVTAKDAVAQERWTASSTTALSVTGHVSFSAHRIRFFNGRVLQLSPPEKAPSFVVAGEPVEAAIYRVVKPRDLKLKNGNHLCGSAGKSRAVTFIAVWKPAPLPGDKEPRGMAAFSGSEMPAAATGPGFCGTYNYLAR
jgi:hypothetical protein